MEQARQENLRLNNYIDQIVQELSEKTPALQKLRRDYDSSVHTVSSLNQKLDSLMDECESLRLEGDDSVRQYRGTLREKERLKALTTDLGRQVKVRRVWFGYLVSNCGVVPFKNVFWDYLEQYKMLIKIIKYHSVDTNIYFV